MLQTTGRRTIDGHDSDDTVAQARSLVRSAKSEVCCSGMICDRSSTFHKMSNTNRLGWLT